MSTIEVETTGPAAGGGAVGRMTDGRVVFVNGALPGEHVTVELTVDKERFARGELIEVLVPSDGRVSAPCASVAAGCGGCDLQHATPEAQRSIKEQVVHDSLARIGKVDEAQLSSIRVSTIPLPARGFRTTVRCGVGADGRAGYRRHGSHELVTPDSCLVAHPLIERILTQSHFPGCQEITVRVGARTGEGLVMVSGKASKVVLPEGVQLPVIGERRARDASYHEEVAGRRWRISARSFFQSRPDGAEALVDQVRRDVDEFATCQDRLVDLYAGVGLFAGSITSAHVTTVEASRSSVADVRHNLAALGTGAKVLAATVDDWRPEPADVVIADPPRDGLARVGVDRVAATDAGTVILVSCDVGALGRDVGLLIGVGYRLERVTLIDMFPHTHHSEVVSVFSR